MKRIFLSIFISMSLIIVLSSAAMASIADDAKRIMAWTQKYYFPAYTETTDLVNETFEVLSILSAYSEKQVTLRYIKREVPSKLSAILTKSENLKAKLVELNKHKLNIPRYNKQIQLMIATLKSTVIESGKFVDDVTSLYESAVSGTGFDLDRIYPLILKRAQIMIKGENSLLSYSVSTSKKNNPQRYINGATICSNNILSYFLEFMIRAIQDDWPKNRRPNNVAKDVVAEVNKGRGYIDKGKEITEKLKKYFSSAKVKSKASPAVSKKYMELVGSFKRSFDIESNVLNQLIDLFGIFKSLPAKLSNNDLKKLVEKWEELYTLYQANLSRQTDLREKEKSLRMKIVQGLL